MHSDCNLKPIPPGARLLPWRTSRVIVPLTAILLGLALLPFGEPLFKFVYRLLRGLPLSSLFETATYYSSAATIIGLMFMIYLLDRPKAFLLPYLLIALLTAGALNSVIKEAAGRARPQWSVVMSDEKLEQVQEFAVEHPRMPISVKKADYWLGLQWNRPFFNDRYGSFPSGHTTAVFVIAAFLAILYPNARFLWYIGAIACGLARVYAKRHYLEDVLVGGGLASLVAYWVFSWQWPYGLMARLRRKLSSKDKPVMVSKERAHSQRIVEIRHL